MSSDFVRKSTATTSKSISSNVSMVAMASNLPTSNTTPNATSSTTNLAPVSSPSTTQPGLNTSIGSGQAGAIMHLPVTASTAPLYKRDIITIVKSLKSNMKNATLCREYILVLHARICGEEKGREEAKKKFILNSTGGIATLLATMSNHVGDPSFNEVALVFLYNLMYPEHKRSLKVISKVVKKGGSRTVISILNKNAGTPRVVYPACMVIVGIASVDTKIGAVARLTGALNTLLVLSKQHVTLPHDLMATVLCCLCSLARTDLNQQHLGKRGCVSLLVEIINKHVAKAGNQLVKWATKCLIHLSEWEENVTALVKEGGVAITLMILYEQYMVVDTQRLTLELLSAMAKTTEGNTQFLQAGGFPHFVNIIVENNGDKAEHELVDLLNQLYVFHGETKLPIGKDNDLCWRAKGGGGGRGGEDGGTTPVECLSGSGSEDDDDSSSDAAEMPSPVTGNSTSGGAGGGENWGNDNYCSPLDAASSSMAAFSPELNNGVITTETALPEQMVVHHVKPFSDTRPAPSCPTSIDFVPPVEELLLQTPVQNRAILLNEFKRFTQPMQLVRSVVYDDLERSVVLPQSHMTTLKQQAMEAVGKTFFPTPPPTSSSSATTFMGSTPVSGGKTSAGGTPTFPSNGPQAQPILTSQPSTSSSQIPTLKFGSNFESGNLKRAIQIFENEYDLILHSDINTTTYHQWFYFSIENMRSDVTYKFNILNMEKPGSTFSEGQRPLLFSEKRFMWSGFGWLRAGHNILYMRNSYRRKTRKRQKEVSGCYYTVTFSVRFPHDADRCYIANCYPYSYSDLLGYLRKLQDTKSQIANFMTVQSLCETQCGNPLPLVTITSFKKNGVPCTKEEITQRMVCIVSARVHPGESNSSYVAKGLIDYLLDNTEAANYLRDHFVWKVVPMLNPDGVINGNHRCALSGKDLNREFVKPDRVETPTIFYLKALVQHIRCEEGRNVMLYGDFHGHSRRKNFFAYACAGAPKKDNVHGIVPAKVFPKLLSELCPFFTFDGSCYKVQKGKRNTGRVVFFKEYGIRMSYTLEGSMMGGDGCDFIPLSWGEVEEDVARRSALAHNTVGHFNTAHYCSVGAMFAKAAYMLHWSANNPSGRANEIISAMVREAATGANTSSSSKNVVESPTSSNFGGGGKNASLEGGDEDISFGAAGSMANTRRNSFRKAQQPQPSTPTTTPSVQSPLTVELVSPAILADVYKSILYNQAPRKARRKGGVALLDESDDELEGSDRESDKEDEEEDDVLDGGPGVEDCVVDEAYDPDEDM